MESSIKLPAGEKLIFIRIARKTKDGYNGFLYLNSWATGWQHIILDKKVQNQL